MLTRTEAIVSKLTEEEREVRREMKERKETSGGKRSKREMKSWPHGPLGKQEASLWLVPWEEKDTGKPQVSFALHFCSFQGTTCWNHQNETIFATEVVVGLSVTQVFTRKSWGLLEFPSGP